MYFKAFTGIMHVPDIVLHQGLIETRLVPRFYALTIERPASREKANDRFASQL